MEITEELIEEAKKMQALIELKGGEYPPVGTLLYNRVTGAWGNVGCLGTVEFNDGTILYGHETISIKTIPKEIILIPPLDWLLDKIRDLSEAFNLEIDDQEAVCYGVVANSPAQTVDFNESDYDPWVATAKALIELRRVK